MIPLSEIIIARIEKAKPGDYPELPFVGLDNIEPQTMHLLGTKSSGDMKSTAKHFYPEDVLYSRLRPYLNKVWCADREGICSSEFIVLSRNKHIEPKFLALRLNALDFVAFANNLNTGDRPRVNFDQIFSFFLPLFSLVQQRAIVAKIEQLFSELDNGIANLKTAKDKLEIYRQAVLKKAFEGELTRKWREKENIYPQSNNLPQDWKWLKLGEVCEHIIDGDHQAPPKAERGIPFITISNIDKSTNTINFNKTFFVKVDYYSKLKYTRKPQEGDILYTVTGSFGIPVLVKDNKEFCFQRHIGLLRPLKTVGQKWLYYLLQSPDVFVQAKEKATGTAQKTVGLRTLRNFRIPFCPPLEQHQIVQEIETRLSVCDNAIKNINEALAKSEALRQSILKKAFEGKLLSDAELQVCRNEPDWEPAEKLLTRIKKTNPRQSQKSCPRRNRIGGK